MLFDLWFSGSGENFPCGGNNTEDFCFVKLLRHPLCTEYGLNELFPDISYDLYNEKALFCALSSKNIAVGFFLQAVALSTECQQFLTTNMSF